MPLSVSDLLKRSLELDFSDSPGLDSLLLLCHSLGVEQSWVKTWPNYLLDVDQLAYFEELLARRQGGEPIAFILGHQGFWTLDLKVSPHTLIPRPETELLVETALSLKLVNNCHALDLGTGSGAIALALASERPDWQITASDSSYEAVQVAQSNCSAYQCANVSIFQSNWYDQIPKGDKTGGYNVILSNPPYIGENDPHLEQGDVRFEPSSALVAGRDGLDALRIVIGRSPAYLAQAGWLLVEHGCDQALDVQNLFKNAGLGKIETRADLNGMDRITFGCLL